MKKTVAQWLEQLLEDVEVTLDRNLKNPNLTTFGFITLTVWK